jgi:hypothetical protein
MIRNTTPKLEREINQVAAAARSGRRKNLINHRIGHEKFFFSFNCRWPHESTTSSSSSKESLQKTCLFGSELACFLSQLRKKPKSIQKNQPTTTTTTTNFKIFCKRPNT